MDVALSTITVATVVGSEVSATSRVAISLRSSVSAIPYSSLPILLITVMSKWPTPALQKFAIPPVEWPI